MSNASITCATKSCQECMSDPDSKCATLHPPVWLKIYDPVFDKCEKSERPPISCENLSKLFASLVHNQKRRKLSDI